MSTSVLISVATFAVVGCAILAAKGFRGRVDTIGVDLGTTFSVVGVKTGQNVNIIEDKSGRVLFPSVVAFLESGDVVGYDAMEHLKAHPQATIFNSKRFIGRSWNDEVTQEYGLSHPYDIVECNTSVSNFSSVAFSVPTGRSRSYTIISPETVATRILTHLRALTADYLGHHQVSKAVIAVPAKFTSNQRAATGAAYKAAGLKVVRVIEEPTAAAVAYKLHTKSNVHHILVYDFGGGTLDVSILYVAKGSVSVYATDGDDDLGGSDFDRCLSEAIETSIGSHPQETNSILHDIAVDKSEEEVKKFLNERLGTSLSNMCTSPTIRQKSEDVKKALTWSTSTEFACDALCVDNTVMEVNNNKYISTKGGRISLKRVSLDITRDFFQDKCGELFQRSLAPVSRLLNDLNMDKNEIDEVVLVGGSTRMPLVKSQLRDFFRGLELNDRIDPDITVAYGAASIVD